MYKKQNWNKIYENKNKILKLLILCIAYFKLLNQAIDGEVEKILIGRKEPELKLFQKTGSFFMGIEKFPIILADIIFAGEK